MGRLKRACKRARKRARKCARKRARKRARWEPTKHFLDEDYSIMFSDLAKIYFQRRLWKDGIGICVFPTIREPCISMEGKPTESKRR